MDINPLRGLHRILPLLSVHRLSSLVRKKESCRSGG